MLKQIYLIVLLGIIFPVAVFARDAILVSEQHVKSAFRDHITFYAKFHGSDQILITEITLFYKLATQRTISRNVVEFTPDVTVSVSFRIDQTEIYFPPGTELEYWWKVIDSEGRELQTERGKFLYLDERHNFHPLSNDRVTLYWYQGNDEFGQALFDQANKGLDQLETNVGIQVTHPIRIFIYANHDDLLGALSLGVHEWTGGVAFTEMSVIAIGIEPNSLDWGLGAMTHEMTHLVIHQATDNPYTNLPHWLDEGIAVYNENPDELDSQFREDFESAVTNNELMTLQTLSSNFPADPVAASLAYGESGSVVKFIIDTYGSDAMKHLLEIFSEGALYDDALQESLGVDMHGLDNAWRESLGLPPLPADATTALPSPEPDMPQDGIVIPTPEQPGSGGRSCMASLIFPVAGIWLKRRN
ncbi:MAG: hypothetical protein B6242_16245 [Anaerolineaceae bacterium 4572_78]|nr:MAG: hypothetical protein B6242_16245 [Anaerolineaceae bacterium 4572_78]